MPLKVDTTALEAKVRETENIEPNERLVVLTDIPERKNNNKNDNNAPNNNNDDDDDAYANATPTRFSIPWNSATLSQMINLSKENFYDEDLDRIIPITVPDCEADVLMMIAMYMEYYHDKPNAVGVTNNNNKDSSSAADGNIDQEGGKPSADNDNDNDDDDHPPHGSAISQARKHTARAKDAIKQQQQAAAAQAPSTGAHLLERPYKPNQMEVDLATVADSEPCLDGYEKYLANRINKMSVKDAVRTVRQLLCAGFFLQMNQSFLDLAGWLLSLRMRGNNVHQIKNMMKDENIEVRLDKI